MSSMRSASAPGGSSRPSGGVAASGAGGGSARKATTSAGGGGGGGGRAGSYRSGQVTNAAGGGRPSGGAGNAGVLSRGSGVGGTRSPAATRRPDTAPISSHAQSYHAQQQEQEQQEQQEEERGRASPRVPIPESSSPATSVIQPGQLRKPLSETSKNSKGSGSKRLAQLRDRMGMRPQQERSEQVARTKKEASAV